MEKTFIMIKPDGVQRGLIGEIVKRFEQKGFRLTAAKLTAISEERAAIHYAEHKGKPFYGELIRYMTSSPIVAMVWEGADIIRLSRLLIGKTNVLEAAPGTIRGDFAFDIGMNLIHGSDSPESAEREIANMFKPQELAANEIYAVR